MTGANNVLPTVPSFVAGAPLLSDLNNLSYAVQFLADQDVRPTWHLFINTTQAITLNTWTNVAFDHVAFDCDGVASTLPNAVIKTQGRYALEACVQIEALAAKASITAAFLFTAGANNPNYTPGQTQFFGYRGTTSSQTSSAAADNAICISTLTPMVLYPADQLNVAVYLGSSMTIDYNENTSFSQGRFATQFTGYWDRLS